MLERAKINENINYFTSINSAIKDVGWVGELVPISVERKYAMIVGPSANEIVKCLLLCNKIKEYHEFRCKKSNNRTYKVQF